MSETVHNYSFEVEDTSTRKYQLDVQENYDYPAPSTIIPLKTCPLTSEVKIIEAPVSAGNTYVFDSSYGAHQFVSTCHKFFFSIPLTVTLATAITDVDIDETNFMTKLFAGSNDICYSQNSFLQGIQSISIDVNNKNITNINNVFETLAQVTPYYSTQDTAEFFHASKSDRYPSFETYTGSSNQTISYINELGNAVQTSVNPTNEANIFGSTYQDGYVSRTPQWTWVSKTATPKQSANLQATFWVYLPLAFGTLPTSSTAMAGIRRLAISFALKSDLASWLFNMKKTSNAYRYSDISVTTGSFATSTAKQITQVYSAPQYMKDRMVDAVTGRMMPYSMAYPRIISTVGSTYPITTASDLNFNISNVQCSVVPESLYISLQRVKKGNFETCATTPITYALLKSLSIRVESSLTNFASTLALTHLADINGYDEMDAVSRLLKGFPVKISLARDISLPKDMVVSENYPFTCEISGTAVNQGPNGEFKLIVTTVAPASLDFDGVDFSISSGVLIDNSVLSDKHFMQNQYSLYQKRINVLGGGMFTDAMKWVGRNALSLAKNAWENREKIAKTVGDVVGLVKAVRGGRMVQTNVSGGAARGTRTLGAGQVRETVFK